MPRIWHRAAPAHGDALGLLFGLPVTTKINTASKASQPTTAL
jgi:hypothetical protein